MQKPGRNFYEASWTDTEHNLPSIARHVPCPDFRHVTLLILPFIQRVLARDSSRSSRIVCMTYVVI